MESKGTYESCSSRDWGLWLLNEYKLSLSLTAKQVPQPLQVLKNPISNSIWMECFNLTMLVHFTVNIVHRTFLVQWDYKALNAAAQSWTTLVFTSIWLKSLQITYGGNCYIFTRNPNFGRRLMHKKRIYTHFDMHYTHTYVHEHKCVQEGHTWGNWLRIWSADRSGPCSVRNGTKLHCTAAPLGGSAAPGYVSMDKFSSCCCTVCLYCMQCVNYTRCKQSGCQEMSPTPEKTRSILCTDQPGPEKIVDGRYGNGETIALCNWPRFSEYFPAVGKCPCTIYPSPRVFRN